MKQFCIFTFAVLTSLSMAAAAEEGSSSSTPASSEGRSQYLYQAPSGSLELTPQIGLAGLTYKYDKDKRTDTLESMTFVGFAEMATIEYGISDMFSVGATLGFTQGVFTHDYSDDTVSSHDEKVSGMINPTLDFNGRLPMGIAALRYGAELSISPENRKYKANGDQNAATGGNSITPYVGTEVAINHRQVVGGKVSYEINLGDKKVTDDTVSKKISGGEDFTVAGFYEFRFPKVAIGADLGVTASKTTKTTTDGTTVDNKDSTTKWFLDIYSPVYLTPTIAILPSLEFSKYTAYNDSSLTSLTGFGLSCGARFAF